MQMDKSFTECLIPKQQVKRILPPQEKEVLPIPNTCYLQIHRNKLWLQKRIFHSVVSLYHSHPILKTMMTYQTVTFCLLFVTLKKQK